MQSTNVRLVILLGLLAVANGLQAFFGNPPPEQSARWPVEETLYAVPGWTVGPASIEDAHGTRFVNREYRRADGTGALLTIATSSHAKRIYKSGAEVPFLGSGYTVDPAPRELVAPTAGIGAAVVRGGQRRYLLLHSLGERRGFELNSASRWGLAVLDAALHRPNDYYKLTLIAPLGQNDARVAQEASAIARTLFARVREWYAR